MIGENEGMCCHVCLEQKTVDPLCTKMQCQEFDKNLTSPLRKYIDTYAYTIYITNSLYVCVYICIPMTHPLHLCLILEQDIQ